MGARSWIPVLATLSVLVAVTCRASSAGGCEKWLAETNRSIEKVPMAQRWDRTLELLAQGCEVVPAALRDGAQKSLRRSRAEQRRALVEASATYFSESCAPGDPGMPASQLLHVCLGSDPPDGAFGSMLENIDAATYLYGKALQQELEKAGLYEPHGARMLGNFFVSNALGRESERAR
jgi:hypothetical protein